MASTWRMLLLLLLAALLALLAPPSTAETASVDDHPVEDAVAEDAAALAAEDAARTAAEAARRADCETRGFDVQTLDCRLCEDLSAFLAHEVGAVESKQSSARAVDADCRACCTDFALAAREDAAIHAQFARAALEVCKRRLERFPKVANFVHNRASQEYPQLEIAYVAGRKPHLVFFDADGARREEISIGNWDEDAISEFIGAKLRPREAEQDDEGEEGDASEATEGPGEDDDDEIVEVEVAADTSV